MGRVGRLARVRRAPDSEDITTNVYMALYSLRDAFTYVTFSVLHSNQV